MAELDALVGRGAVTTLEAVGLVGVEVGDGADFEPTLLGFAVDFEVVAEGGGEADVAAAEAEDAIGQLELEEQAFDVVEHFLVGTGGVFGRVDAHELYFGELVKAVEPAHVFAVAAGFAAEALGVGAILDGEVALAEDDVAVDVGDGHFGGGDEVEVVGLAVVHLAFFVGQLACAEA